MASHQDEDDLNPTTTPGYKAGAAKTTEEYANLDAEDESLARWKASLGIVPGASTTGTGPKVSVLTLELASLTLPAGKSVVINLADSARLASLKKNPLTIKEGVEYNVRITFKVNHSIISGVRYIQVVKRAGVKVDKLEQMLGSYGPNPSGEPYTKNFEPEESPSGLLARSGTYSVRSRVIDDDGEVYAGALVMRGAGCTINDMWDKNLDKAVARTKERPLARGDLTREDAFIFLGAQLSVGLAVLLQFNWYSILLGASSLSLVTIYPLMKRITHWPQAVLGLAFNWGALLGWSAVAGTVDWTVCLPLYAGGVCWTLVYDSIYAHQDKSDDVHAGIKSTALLFGDHSRSILTGLSASTISLVSYAGYLNHHTETFYAGVTLAALQLGRILYRTDFNDRASCWKGFVGSGWAGFWIWMGAFADYGLTLV
ncbi:hypothetical protein EST38_g1214 [Candolleomyces aberdarensis]|uniref:4-hydroxybenzoate polyprenyltransferase, mitochondrial n=1 Tax=Candolleomyces aberdarensis TaxID=2316362 RepID=A0A4Q2DWK6_9AGAR|nr:hypothetical protein EST38_g1214 [Candolleomyces aberdarensis]